LFDAAHLDRPEAVKSLIAAGVDPASLFARSAHLNLDEDRRDTHTHSEEPTSLLECAVGNLSGSVVSFLLDGRHVPRRHIKQDLLTKSVGLVLSVCEERVKQMAIDRLTILKRLVANGLDTLKPFNDERDGIMYNVLRCICMGDEGFGGTITPVPISAELVNWLCSQGHDLAVAVEQFSWRANGKEWPSWLMDMLELSKGTWAVADAVGRGAPSAELEALLQGCTADVHTITDQSGRRLIECAVLKNQSESLDWLVKAKGTDLDAKNNDGMTVYDQATQLGLTEMVRQIQWLRKWKKKQVKAQKARERKMKEQVVRVQSAFRGRCARKLFCRLREMQKLGVWAHVVSAVVDRETGRVSCPSHTGKSWAQLKLELDFLVQEESEFLDAALQSDATVGIDADKEGVLVSASGADTGTQGQVQADSKEMHRNVNSIQLTAEALRWLRKQKDEKYRLLFTHRLEQLARGDRSYCLSKQLKGSSRRVVETKLDAGQRIIWTQRGSDILVWFVCKHKHISRCVQLVEKAYDRALEASGTTAASEEKEANGGNEESEAEPMFLVNPTANVPLKIHAVRTSELPQLAVDRSWTPPLKLTPEEQRIVTKKGTVLLLGRSGTGKTICVCNRMAYDRQVHGRQLKQLFVARTQRICDYVRGLQEGAGEDLTSIEFMKMESLNVHLSQVLSEGNSSSGWDSRKFISYKRFSERVWGEIKGDEPELNVLQVWTQIRSFIKGSFEAASQSSALTRAQYVDGLGKDRCRLGVASRKRAYEIFSRYSALLDRHGWWDECDRTMQITTQLMQRQQRLQEGRGALDAHAPLFDRIYADEVQDTTQAEVGMLLLAVGGRCDALFLAGDTAQAIVHGIDFRFEEVRSAVYMVSGATQRVERFEKLCHNFRSHVGILETANLVLRHLHYAFPNAATKLPLDQGMFLGPRPVLLKAKHDAINHLIRGNQRLRVLVRDEYKPELLEKLDAEAKHACFGIREAKGLEFQDVAVVDFFASQTDSEQQRAWKKLLLDSEAAGGKRQRAQEHALLSLPAGMELELKLLYVAVTRSCNRLFFVETADTQGGEAWTRCLQREQLAQMMHADVETILHDTKTAMMTADDWRAEGIDVASVAEDDDIGSLALLQRAIACFQKAGDTELESRARAHLSAIEHEQEPHRDSMSDVETSGALNSVKDAVLAYLNAGMLRDAARLCEVHCAIPQLNGLGKRIIRLYAREHCQMGLP